MGGFQAENLSVEMRPGGIALLGFDVPGRTHNVFNRQVLTDLDQALDKLAADPSLQLLVAVSRKSTGFIAGADLHAFTAVQSPADAMALSAAGQRLFDKVAGFPVPTVAVIHGPCLGGGLEFALACDYRVAIDQPGTQLGLPELKLGLIPAWGGTQRLPRVIGIERAFQIILQLRQVNAPDALRWGLVDAVQPSQDEALALIAGSFGEHARKQGKRPKGKPPVRTWRQRLLEATPPGRWALFRATERIVRRRLPDDMPAPLEALHAIRVGMRQGLAAGLTLEREAVGRLATTNACRNLITLFFLMENAKAEGKEARGGEGVKPSLRVGVVGAGTMGAGIAQLAAVKNCAVIVQEVNNAALQAGVQRIEDLFNKAVANRVLSADAARRKLESIGQTTTYAGFENVDLVIEAAIEDLAKKKEIFQDLERHTRPDAILATNTSSLSVQDLQQGLAHPERVGGLHFFNPVHKMPLVEVIRAPQTAEAVSGTLTRWAASVGKTPVLVKDSPGFVVNRILFPYLNEAGMLVAERMPIEVVDRVMRRFGMPMGPLELLDQVGLDVAAHVAKAVGPVFRDRLTPHPALEQMCARGWLGQKSGAGFYRYQGKKKKVNTEALAALLGEVGRHDGAVGKQLDPEKLLEARERMVLLMVNEAAAYLAEGLAPSADVIDLAMVLGTGWAPQRGGPLCYADDRGAGDIVATLERLARKLGPRFEPCAELRRRAATKEPFYHLLLDQLAAKIAT